MPSTSGTTDYVGVANLYAYGPCTQSVLPTLHIIRVHTYNTCVRSGSDMEADTVDCRDFLHSLLTLFTTPPVTPSPPSPPPPFNTPTSPGNKLWVSLSSISAVSSRSRLIFCEIESFRPPLLLASSWLPSSSSMLVSLILQCSKSAFEQLWSPLWKYREIT